ncbi:MAG: hypothetical protein U0457_21670 [Candidatus Sericytochromatia bacterium]
MESILLNGHQLDVQGIKELKNGLSIQEAASKTNKNGLDEVYFSVNGKNYLAYGDALKIGELSQNKIASVTYKGYTGTVVAYQNEANSVGEGVKNGALEGLKKAKDAVLGAVGSTITSIGPTSTVAVAGVVGLTGLAMYRGIALQGASPIGNMLGDLLKNGSIGALKVITVAGAIGFGVATIGGAIGGISESLGKEKDYSSIASVTKDGNFGATEANPPTPAPSANSMPMQMQGSDQEVFSRPNRPTPSNNFEFGSVSSFLTNRQ